MKLNKNIQKLYCLALPLLPVMAQYRFFGGKVDLDVLVMLFILLAVIITPGFSISFNSYFVLLISYTLFVTFIGVFRSPEYSSDFDVWLRCFKYCVYIFIVGFLGKKGLWNYELFMRYYRRVVYLAFAYILIQAVFYYGAGIMLPSAIGSQTTEITEYHNIGRLHSFYSEPAELAYSTIPFICCSLFASKKHFKRRDLTGALVGTVLILLSTSSQGIVVLGVVWGIWILMLNSNRSVAVYKLLGVVGIFALIYLAYRYGLLDYTFTRLDSEEGGNAFSARNSGYTALTLLDFVELIFGTGYGNYINENKYGLEIWGTNVYYSSFAEYIFTTGIVGLLLFYLYLLSKCGKRKRVANVLVLVFLIFSIGGSPTTAKYLPIYLSLIIMKPSEYDSTEIGEGV